MLWRQKKGSRAFLLSLLSNHDQAKQMKNILNCSCLWSNFSFPSGKRLGSDVYCYLHSWSVFSRSFLKHSGVNLWTTIWLTIDRLEVGIGWVAEESMGEQPGFFNRSKKCSLALLQIFQLSSQHATKKIKRKHNVKVVEKVVPNDSERVTSLFNLDSA